MTTLADPDTSPPEHKTTTYLTAMDADQQSAYDVRHYAGVENRRKSRFPRPAGASCTCGWTAREYSREHARRAAKNHRDQMAATPLPDVRRELRRPGESRVLVRVHPHTGAPWVMVEPESGWEFYAYPWTWFDLGGLRRDWDVGPPHLDEHSEGRTGFWLVCRHGGNTRLGWRPGTVPAVA
jgi:hypothetical protein